LGCLLDLCFATDARRRSGGTHGRMGGRLSGAKRVRGARERVPRQGAVPWMLRFRRDGSVSVSTRCGTA